MATSSNLDWGMTLEGGVCVAGTPAALNLVRNCLSVVAPFLVLQVRQISCRFRFWSEPPLAMGFLWSMSMRSMPGFRPQYMHLPFWALKSSLFSSGEKLLRRLWGSSNSYMVCFLGDDRWYGFQCRFLLSVWLRILAMDAAEDSPMQSSSTNGFALKVGFDAKVVRGGSVAALGQAMFLRSGREQPHSSVLLDSSLDIVFRSFLVLSEFPPVMCHVA